MKSTYNYLLKQVKHPTGIIGYSLTKIWNSTFDRMTDWGLLASDIDGTSRILDVGCGGGETVAKLSQKITTGKVYGVDISAEAIRSTRETAKKGIKEGNVELTVADVAHLPFEDNYFQMVTAVQTHMYWEDVKVGLSEIYRVMSERSLLVIVTEKDKIEYHMTDYKDKQDFLALLKRIGFERNEVREQENWISYYCYKEVSRSHMTNLPC